MVHEDDPGVSSYEHVFTLDKRVVHDNKFWLRIEMDGKFFDLPFVDVTPQLPDANTIAWLDTNPLVNFSLSEAAANVMERMLRKTGGRAFVTTTSTKSGYFITKAVNRVGGILLTMPAGREREIVVAHSLGGVVDDYSAVTANQEPKYMGAPKDISPSWLEALEEKGFVVWVDDVDSTGATKRKGTEILGQYLPPETRWMYRFLAKESVLDENYPATLDADTMANIAIPVFRGLDRAMLFTIQDRIRIPRAKEFVPPVSV